MTRFVDNRYRFQRRRCLMPEGSAPAHILLSQPWRASPSLRLDATVLDNPGPLLPSHLLQVSKLCGGPPTSVTPSLPASSLTPGWVMNLFELRIQVLDDRSSYSGWGEHPLSLLHGEVLEAFLCHRWRVR